MPMTQLLGNGAQGTTDPFHGGELAAAGGDPHVREAGNGLCQKCIELIAECVRVAIGRLDRIEGPLDGSGGLFGIRDRDREIGCQSLLRRRNLGGKPPRLHGGDHLVGGGSGLSLVGAGPSGRADAGCQERRKDQSKERPHDNVVPVHTRWDTPAWNQELRPSWAPHALGITHLTRWLADCGLGQISHLLPQACVGHPHLGTSTPTGAPRQWRHGNDSSPGSGRSVHWRFIISERIELEDDTEAVRRFLQHVDLDRCLRPATWLQFSVVQIEPDGDIVPVRADYERRGEWQIGINPLIC